MKKLPVAPKAPKGFHRETLSWELKEEHWQVLLEFFKDSRFLPLVKFFYEEGNAPTSGKVLHDIVPWPYHRRQAFNSLLHKNDLPFSLRVRKRSEGQYKLQFCRVTNNPHRAPNPGSG